MESFIFAHNISKNFIFNNNQIIILQNINLKLNKGKSAAISGISGSGKTTFLSILAGLEPATSGNIYIDNTNISNLSINEKSIFRRDNLGFIFQDFQLLPNLTAIENVMLALEIKNIPNAKQKSIAILEKVNLKHRLNHFPNQLSGGEKQRVAIARAFVSNPKVLLADEPTANLDQKTTNIIKNFLFELQKEYQTTMILVTHDPLLANLCDNKYELKNGELF